MSNCTCPPEAGTHKHDCPLHPVNVLGGGARLMDLARARGVVRDIGGLTSVVEQCMRTIRIKEHFLTHLRQTLPADHAAQVAADLASIHDRLAKAVIPDSSPDMLEAVAVAAPISN